MKAYSLRRVGERQGLCEVMVDGGSFIRRNEELSAGGLR